MTMQELENWQARQYDTLKARVAELEQHRREDVALMESTSATMAAGVETVNALRAEADRYLRALVHIRSNAESMLRAHEMCAKIAGEFVETPEFINARWNYTEANTALNL